MHWLSNALSNFTFMQFIYHLTNAKPTHFMSFNLVFSNNFQFSFAFIHFFFYFCIMLQLNKQMCNIFSVCVHCTDVSLLAPAPTRLSDYKIWLFFVLLLIHCFRLGGKISIFQSLCVFFLCFPHSFQIWVMCVCGFEFCVSFELDCGAGLLFFLSSSTKWKHEYHLCDWGKIYSDIWIEFQIYTIYL